MHGTRLGLTNSLTFSCAEYESPDITEYLRRVNNISSTYNIGKLCTEDPVSVSRKFSLKFHAFFRTVILKGEVLGKVDHFYWEIEYQARGALIYYHVLLWIRDASVIGVDDPEKVLAWIQERITCYIPDMQQNLTCNKICKSRKPSCPSPFHSNNGEPATRVISATTHLAHPLLTVKSPGAHNSKHIEPAPTIEVHVSNPNGSASIKALPDSGADILLQE